jgi:hypothetical protein
MISEFLQEQFNVRAETPAIWALSARHLKHSADLIFDAYEIDLQQMARDVSPLELNNLEVASAATLLFGLAIENLLKAIIISKEPKTVEDGKLRNWHGNGHELILLAEKANIMLDEQQKDLLQRLVAFVEWAGRYPVPKKASKLSMKQLNIKQPFLPSPLQPFERELFEQLFESLLSFVFSDAAA